MDPIKDIDSQETEVNENEQNQSQETNTEENSGGEEQTGSGQTDEKVAKKDEEKLVPLAALKESRYHNRQLKAELKKMQEQYEKSVQQQQEFYKRFEPQPPEFEKDPGGHLLTKQQQLEKRLSEMQAHQAEQQKAGKQQAEHQEFMQRYRLAATEYSAERPDFKEAYQHLIKARVAELEAAGYPEERIAAMVQNDELSIVRDSFEDDINPASRLYALAVARGYKAGKVAEETKKLEVLQKGISSGKTLSKGGASNKGLTMETLANMSDEEFAKQDPEIVNRILRGQTVQ